MSKWKGKAIEALDHEIEVWHKLSSLTTAQHDRPDGSRNSLCHSFLGDIENAPCRECPVALYTGYDNCQNKPLYDWFIYAFPEHDYRPEKATDEAMVQLRFLEMIRNFVACGMVKPRRQ